MTEQAKVPAIRFAGFTDPWEQRKLGDIAERVTRKNENNESDLPLTISAQHGLIDQRLFFNAQVASRDMSGYYLLRQGEFAYNKSTSADSPWGAIKRLTRYEKGCVSTLYICFALLNANPDYLVTYYETNRWHKAVQMIAAEGARNHGLLNIAPDDFFDTMVSLPESQAEQQTIGAFFSRLDSLITLHQRKYDKLVILKKSMLEKMFPKDGESVPEIRFAGFTDPWEQRKLSEVATFGGGHTPPMADPDNYEDGYVLWVTSQDVKSNYLDRTTTQITEKGAKELTLYPAGSLVMVTRSGILRHTLPVAELRKPSTVNQDIRVILPQGECCGEWLLQFFISHNKELLLEFGKTGTTVESVDFGKIKDMLLYMPSTVEQQQIGDFFAKLDSLITLHQRKYDKLVIFKKSMLEKMFPKDGESVPEIRFAGFTDPWEQRKLGDVASSFDYGLNAAATEYDGQNKYLRITDIDDETHEFSKSDLTTPLADLAMSADYLLKEGDLLFARTGASVGKTYLYRQFDGMVYFAGFLIRARIGEGADPEFAYQATLTDAYKKYVAITSQRSGQPGVNAQEYADYQLMLPSKTEQQQIGMTLRSLDDLITLHQRKLELLQNIKKSLLDKMFV